MNKSIIKTIEVNLSLPTDFLENLLSEDDWSFIVKIHVLVEAACTNMLLFHFQEPEISEALSFLELADSRRGKIVFLKKLDLITSEDSKMIMQLGKLRNDFAHKISDIYKTLDDKFNAFDKQQKKNFLEAFPLEGALAASLMRDYHHIHSLPKLEPKNIITKIKNKEYNLKLQVWASVFRFLLRVIEMEDFSNFRQLEKAEQVKKR